MERFALEKAERHRIIKQRMEEERLAELANKNLEPVSGKSLANLEEMDSGEMSNLRKRIFMNHEITMSRAN